MIQNPFKRGALLVASVLWMGLSACAEGGYSDKQPTSSKSTKYSKKSTAEDLSFNKRWQPNPENTIPFVMNEPVKKMVSKFSTTWKSSFDKWIHRIGLYGPTLEKILKEEGVPEDLIYLSMIESGFNLSAKSHASAVGPWQFIQSTGRMYGLNHDLFMDDRRDLIVATRAAARHLKDLYQEFGDWYLAFAAYNAGSGGVNRVIRKSGSRDFFKMAKTRYMHPETKEYVPKILAAMHIVKNYRDFGYTESDFSMPLQYEVASVSDATDIQFISSSTQTPIETLIQLNPALVSGVTRPQKETLVYVPRGKKLAFTKSYEQNPSKRVSPLIHTAQSQDTLKSLASYYGTSTEAIAKLNQLSPNAALRKGQTVKIPPHEDILATLSQKPLGYSKSGSSGKTVYHKVKKGETLSKIAARYGTSSSQLAKWNKLSKKSKLRNGQSLKIVRKGSSGESISRPFYAYGFAGHSWSVPSSDLSGSSSVFVRNDISPSDAEENSDSQASQSETTTVALAESSKSENSDESVEAVESGLSGVAHLIFLEDQNPDEDNFEEDATQDQLASNQNPDITQVSASEEDGSAYVTDDEFPGFVKTNEALAAKNDTVSSKNTDTKAVPVFHIVKRGENLGQIAAKYKTSIQALKKINKLSGNTVLVNQKLKIKESLQPSPTLKKSSSNAFWVYKIKSGDTLWSLAKKYNVAVSDLKKNNGLTSNELALNQSIKIPGSKNQ